MMCANCWEQYGAPQLDSPAIRDAVTLINKVYEDHSAGGSLHVIVDDFNIDDEFFEDDEMLNVDSTPQRTAIETECFNALLKLSVEERASALALQSGYWGS